MSPTSAGSPAHGIDIAAHSPGSGRFRSDPILFTVILLLTALGVVMVYSSSAIFAQQRFSDSHHFLVRDLVWITLGFVAMAITMRLDYRFYARVANPLLAVAFVLLCAVLLVGARRNGAQRWFSLAGFSFQPAELGKLAIVVFLAHTLSRKRDQVDDFLRGFLPPLLVCGVFMLLLLKQPDLGTAAILGGVTLLLLFVAAADLVMLIRRRLLSPIHRMKSAADLFARNIYGDLWPQHATNARQTQVARWTSLLVKFGALLFVLYVPSSFAIQLQLLGGIWILQTLPTLVLGLFTRFLRAPALLLGWAVGMCVGTGMGAAGIFETL